MCLFCVPHLEGRSSTRYLEDSWEQIAISSQEGKWETAGRLMSVPVKVTPSECRHCGLVQPQLCSEPEPKLRFLI